MKSILTLTFLMISFCAFAQSGTRIYDPAEDAGARLASAVSQANAQDKHILVQIGGNWCPWCIRFHHFVHADEVADSLLRADYVVVLLNYSKENKNLPLLARFGYPQRFGFPVFVVLDGEGNRLHTQDSGLLESGEGYDPRKVRDFLRNWSPAALVADRYK